MTYSDLISDIISRCDADYADEYEDRAKALFLSAVAQLIGAGEYKLNDIPELVASEEVTLDATGKFTFLGADNDLTGDPIVVDIAEIYDDPDSADDGYVYVKKEIAYIRGISQNSQLAPDTKELFWYYRGSDIIFYPKATASGKKPTLLYIKSPEQWSDDDEMLGKYSQPFIQRAADITADKLNKEVN